MNVVLAQAARVTLSNGEVPKEASRLLGELQGSRLEVAKVPGRDGGYVRVLVSVNAKWYRRFCGEYLGHRRRYPRPRTIIKRCHTIAALQRIIRGERKASTLGGYWKRFTYNPKKG